MWTEDELNSNFIIAVIALGASVLVLIILSIVLFIFHFQIKKKLNTLEETIRERLFKDSSKAEKDGKNDKYMDDNEIRSDFVRRNEPEPFGHLPMEPYYESDRYYDQNVAAKPQIPRVPTFSNLNRYPGAQELQQIQQMNEQKPFRGDNVESRWNQYENRQLKDPIEYRRAASERLGRSNSLHGNHGVNAGGRRAYERSPNRMGY